MLDMTILDIDITHAFMRPSLDPLSCTVTSLGVVTTLVSSCPPIKLSLLYSHLTTPVSRTPICPFLVLPALREGRGSVNSWSIIQSWLMIDPLLEQSAGGSEAMTGSNNTEGSSEVGSPGETSNSNNQDAKTADNNATAAAVTTEYIETFTASNGNNFQTDFQAQQATQPNFQYTWQWYSCTQVVSSTSSTCRGFCNEESALLRLVSTTSAYTYRHCKWHCWTTKTTSFGIILEASSFCDRSIYATLFHLPIASIILFVETKHCAASIYFNDDLSIISTL